MKKPLQILNGAAFVLTAYINYLSNTGKINGTSIGEVSESLYTLFTPAGYAFSIWGIIYLLVLGFVIFQGRSLVVAVPNDDFVLKTGWWFIISCVANCAWIYCWLYEYTGLSLFCMFLLLFSLLKIVINNRMELWDAPLSVIAFLWWPFVVYSGWITVASIANVSAYLVKIGWGQLGFSETFWTVSMALVAGIINLWVTWQRNMREFALVGTWALIAIAVANWKTDETVVYTTLLMAVILFVSSSIHGYRNRTTSPFVKFNQIKHR